jgi:glycosyltransferase involved in cell wall biosynthesis
VKVLITVPRLDLSGGVANYYVALRPHLEDEIRYIEIGATSGEITLTASVRRLLTDFWYFHRELRTHSYQLVHINPSLGINSVIRDGLLVLIAKLHGRKVLIFFRGWDPLCEQRIRRNYAGIFRNVFGRADAFIVLAKEFKQKLYEMGMRVPVFVETTVVDDRLISDVGQSRGSQDSGARSVSILFLGRLDRDKGLLESIEAFSILRNRIPDINLIIAGDGREKRAAEQLVENQKIDGVQFAGHVEGEEKRRVFETADIFIFPSFYGEGMPNAVLEAMAFGLPIITRSVGGLKDFFEDSRMGFITESKNPTIFAELLGRLVEDSGLRHAMGEYNRHYALERFSASNVAAKLVGIYEQVGAPAE